MMTTPVRAFQRHDEETVRRICIDNGRFPERIRPADWLFADYWTRYYTRHEPEHCWVADRDGAVAGYLTAAFDTKRFRATMKRRLLPWMLLRSALNGTIAEARSRDFLLKRIAAWNHPEPDPPGLLDRYPGHLHVNLREGMRSGGLGSALMEACFEQARKERLAGLHLDTLAENDGARRFFEEHGFKEIARRFPFRLIDPAMKERAVVLYARGLP